MSDIDIAAALIQKHAVGKDNLGLTYRCSSASAVDAAKALINAGYTLRDTQLEERVAKVERWINGDFT